MTGGRGNPPVLTHLGPAFRALTLNRPDKGNALDLPTASAFLDAVEEAVADESRPVLLITARGRMFCAGGDVRAMAAAEHPARFLDELVNTMHSAVVRLRESHLMVVAAAQGPAAGAGVGIILAADFAMCSSSASFLSAYDAIGLTPDLGLSYMVPRIAGPQRAARFLYAGERLSAEEALAWGLVGSVVADDELEARAAGLVNRLTSGQTQVLGPTKRLVSGDGLAFREHLEQERASITRMIEDPESRAQIAAFAGGAIRTDR